MPRRRYRSESKALDTRDIEIGQRIGLQRLIMKLSQTELANTLGVTVQQIQKYEKGLSRIGASQLTKIAEALNIPITYFYDGKVELPEVKGRPKGQGEAAYKALPLLRTAGVVRVARAFAKMTPEIRKHFLALIEEVALASQRRR
jgi:transcriptional regulator with XRE-family HTH domain